jgi:hypothetical protein
MPQSGRLERVTEDPCQHLTARQSSADILGQLVETANGRLPAPDKKAATPSKKSHPQERAVIILTLPPRCISLALLLWRGVGDRSEAGLTAQAGHVVRIATDPRATLVAGSAAERPPFDIVAAGPAAANWGTKWCASR